MAKKKVPVRPKTQPELAYPSVLIKRGGGGSGGDSSQEIINLQNEINALKIRMTAAETDRNRWLGQWNDQTTYVKSDQVEDAGWLAIAKTTTTERPAPQNQGGIVEAFPVAPTYSTQTVADHVYTAIELEFLVGGWIKSVYFYVTEVTPTTSYSLIYRNITDPNSIKTNLISNLPLSALTKNKLPVNSIGVIAGSKYQFIMDSLDTSSTSSIQGTWIYDGTSNASGPPNQSWNKRQTNDVVRLNKFDFVSQDRTADLLSVIPNTIITFSQISDSSAKEEYRVLDAPIDDGAHVTFNCIRISSGNEIIAGEQTAVNLEVPVAGSTEYVVHTDYWLTNQPSFANCQGVIQFGGGAPTTSNDAYGIEIDFQQAAFPNDWDLQALTRG